MIFVQEGMVSRSASERQENKTNEHEACRYIARTLYILSVLCCCIDCLLVHLSNHA